MSTFLHFDGMTWPNPDDPQEIEHRLRYGAPTREQMHLAASFIAAYKQLVRDPARRRNAKVAGIRRALAEAGPGSTSPEPGRPCKLADWCVVTGPHDAYGCALSTEDGAASPYCPHGCERSRSCAKCASGLAAESTKEGAE